MVPQAHEIGFGSRGKRIGRWARRVLDLTVTGDDPIDAELPADHIQQRVEIDRFGKKGIMSLPAELSRQLDVMVEERGLPSRSQLIAELIRNELAEHGAAIRPEDMARPISSPPRISRRS